MQHQQNKIINHDNGDLDVPEDMPLSQKQERVQQNIIIQKQEPNKKKKAILNDHSIEVSFQNLFIIAKVKEPVLQPDGKFKDMVVEKTILNNLNGKFKPGHFTAILGPTGCGKTTLLNFMSGRLTSDNLTIYGQYYLNGNKVSSVDKYGNQIAYVMQDDILLGVFTPKESFTFVANLRYRDLTAKEKEDKVNTLISELGITNCQNTPIGNAQLRGISGGERKRTSIGVELLTDPSIIFLDEPTTGLDSSTAFKLIDLLKGLSSKGVNVISTIHQPSSEIFNAFDKLVLMVRGNIIYHGNAQKSLDYFQKLNLTVGEYQNPANHYMKLMSDEGVMIDEINRGNVDITEEEVKKLFQDRITYLVASYRQSKTYIKIKDSKVEDNKKELIIKSDTNVNNFQQFLLLIMRSFTYEIRHPLAVRVKILQQIIFSLLTIVVFYNLEDSGYAAIQNRNGALFMIVTMQAFGAVNEALAIFSGERPVFLRERSNKSYEVMPYFWGKSFAEFPFHCLYPILSVSICYFAIGLNSYVASKFFILNGICLLVFWAGVSYGIFMSVVIPQIEVAMALTPLLIIPLMVLGGLFVNLNNVPDYLKWIEYLSFFKYGFQAAAQNEFSDRPPFNCGCVKPNLMDPQYLLLKEQLGIKNDNICIPVPCDALKQAGYKEDMATSMWALFLLGLSFRILSLIGLHLISNPRRPEIKEPIVDQDKIKKYQDDAEIVNK